MIEDLKHQCDYFYYCLKFGEVLAGLTMSLQKKVPIFYFRRSPDDNSERNKCIFTMGNMTPGDSTALIFVKERSLIFNPHSRNVTRIQLDVQMEQLCSL
jgi:hypothetical protein